jgi:hypothetical protein
MSIEVRCANGHVLKVKDSLAGKIGRCPVCRALVKVPKPAISEDEILAMLNKSLGRKMSRPENADPEQRQTGAAGAPPSGLPPLRRQRICSACGHAVAYFFAARCTYCGALLPKVDDTWSQ